MPSLAVRVSARPALRSLMVAAAAWNKSAPFRLLLVGLTAAGGGLVRWSSNRVGRSGGVQHEVDFVLGPRRRGDAGSGVVARTWSLFRSELLVVVSLLRPASPGSSSLSGASEGGDNCCSAFSRFAGLQACWHDEAEDDDFPLAKSSASNKVLPALWGCGGGGGEARPRLAPAFSAFRGPRDRCVFSLSSGVRCNVSC